MVQRRVLDHPDHNTPGIVGRRGSLQNGERPSRFVRSCGFLVHSSSLTSGSRGTHRLELFSEKQIEPFWSRVLVIADRAISAVYVHDGIAMAEDAIA
jgi:hypothetical protein